MIPDNLWEWMFAPVLIFIWAGFEMVAYFWRPAIDVLTVWLLWKISRRLSHDWRWK